MGKALVLKGCNFSANKVTTVTLESTKPCTGISLDRATATLNAVGATLTLVATPRPADTTDPIVWTSSDENVVTVNNGIVTEVGVGSATITATCGSYTATCTVTASAIITGVRLYPDAIASGEGTYSGGNGLGYINAYGGDQVMGAYAGSSGSLALYNTYHDATYYPIILPNNTARIRITTTDSTLRASTILLMSSTVSASGHSTVAQLVEKIGWSALNPTNNTVTVSITNHDGYPTIDSVIIGFQKTSPTFLDSDFDKITVEALPAA